MLLAEELNPDNLSQVSSFIIRNERKCVSLSSLFHKSGGTAMPSSVKYKVFVFKDSESSRIKGVSTFSNSGQILHCLDFSDWKEVEAFKAFMSREIPHDRVFCVLGEKTGTDMIRSCMKKPLHTSIDYILMYFPETEGGNRLNPPPGMEPVQCRPQDSDKLYPLQKAYEIEEVLLDPEDFDPDFCRLNLRRLLREQLILGLSVQKQDSCSFVAKGGTNAIGSGWCQLGGIYTAPEYRNLGCAAFLSRELAAQLAAKGKRTALFVKTGNLAAQKAYEKAGFVKDIPFCICYF